MLISVCYLLLRYKVLQNFANENSNKHLLSHTFSLGQKFGGGLAGWSGLGVSHEVAVKSSAQATVIWRLDWSWGSTSKLAASRDWLVGAGNWWEPSAIYHENIPQGCLSVFMTWHLASPWDSAVIQGSKAKAIMLFITKCRKSHTDTSTMSYWSHRSVLFIVEGAWIAGDKNHCRPFWRLITIVSFIYCYLF